MPSNPIVPLPNSALLGLSQASLARAVSVNPQRATIATKLLPREGFSHTVDITGLQPVLLGSQPGRTGAPQGVVDITRQTLPPSAPTDLIGLRHGVHAGLFGWPGPWERLRRIREGAWIGPLSKFPPGETVEDPEPEVRTDKPVVLEVPGVLETMDWTLPCAVCFRIRKTFPKYLPSWTRSARSGMMGGIEEVEMPAWESGLIKSEVSTLIEEDAKGRASSLCAGLHCDRFACTATEVDVESIEPVGERVYTYESMGVVGYRATQAIWNLGVQLVWTQYSYVMRVCCGCR